MTKEGLVPIPFRLNGETMNGFIGLVLDEHGEPRFGQTIFEFGQNVDFIDPTGVVVLSNLFEYLAKKGAGVRTRFHKPFAPMVVYLDDIGFFQRYMGSSLRSSAHRRASTVPLERVRTERMQEYLEFKLMPWVAARVGLDPESVAGVKVCFEEILNNITDHAGVHLGCAFAQFFPKSEHIQVAISDFGRGIPNLVRTQLPDLSDLQALQKACEEGFTTKSNVRNRGAGLPTLMRFVTQVNRGTVLLASGSAQILAHGYHGGLRLRTHSRGFYPGTLVKVILRTDTFEAMEADIQAEPFQW